MARCRVRNLTGLPITLPAPYGRLLHAGQAVVVADSRDIVVAKLGGNAVVSGLLDILDVEDGQVFDLPSGGTAGFSSASVGKSIDIYLSPLGSALGSGTKLSPMSSPDDVLAVFPVFSFGSGRTKVHYADSLGRWDDDLNYDGLGGQATYTASALWVWSNESQRTAYMHRGPQMVRATVAGGNNFIDAANVKTLSTPAVSAKTRVTLGTSPGWTVNDLQRKFARFVNTVSGKLVIWEMPITTNTANSFDMDNTSINAGLTADLANMTIEIVVPGAIIAAPVGGQITLKGLDCSLHSSILAEEGCALERLAFNSSTQVMDSGCAVDRCTFNASGRFVGFNWGFVNCIFGARQAFLAGATGQGVAIARPDSTTSPEVQTTTSCVEIISYGAVFLGGSASTAGKGSPFAYKAMRNFSIYNANSSVIVAFANSIWQTDNVHTYTTSVIAIQGSGNTAQTGFQTNDNGMIFFDSPATFPNEISITPSISGWAFVTPELAATPNGIAAGVGVGNFEEVAGYNGFYTHRQSGTATAPLGGSGIVATHQRGFGLGN